MIVKKLLSIVVTMALLIGLLPAAGLVPSAEAAGDPMEGRRFIFPNEQITPGNARIVAESMITLQGTIHDIVGNTISYNVKQVTLDGNKLNETEEITTGIQTTGDNRITVSGLILFPGLNKITFTGISGASRVEESIYIEYRDSPMLYDLKLLFENQEYELSENQITMLYSSQPNVVTSGNIVITGKAPNAQKVTVLINGRSYDFVVSSSSPDNRFSTTALTIDPGINEITFKVHNGNQITETTRKVAFYNGAVTFYDMKLTDGTNASNQASMTPNLNFSTTTVNGNIITGTAIVPLPIYDLSNSDPQNHGNTVSPSAAELAKLLTVELKQGATAISVPALAAGDITHIDTTDPNFAAVTFKVTLPTLDFDKAYQLRFKAPNRTVYSYSDWYTFTLRDKTKAYIHEVKYLSGYSNGMTESRVKGLQGTTIPSGGVNVYSMPMAVEVLVGNYGSNSGTDMFDLGTGGYDFEQLNFSETVYRNIDNQQVPFQRLFVVITKMPKSGTNTIPFKLKPSGASGEVVNVVAKLLYGPFVKFDKVVNGMSVEYDAVNHTLDDILTKLGRFQGELMNVANPADIRYADDTSSSPVKRQSVFMYVNNVEIPLVQRDPNVKRTFIPDFSAATDLETKLGNIINKAGDNTVKFVFNNATDVYESTMKFTVVPSNLPVVPAPNTEGVYPYSSNGARIPNDPKFEKNGSIFTTKEADFNVFGTFDFIDLGTNLAAVQSKWASLNTTHSNYIVMIDSPNWKTPVKWDLSKGFKVMEDGVEVGYSSATPPDNVSTPYALIDFYYDLKGQHFAFDLRKQKMPIDGSPEVYTITVFNSGEAGPRATYRLQINSVSIPYTILSPLPENRITNQDYVELIIHSPGADSIMVGKDYAEKVTFIEYEGGLEVYRDAFRYVYKKLGANKETKIPFVITRGQDKIKQDLIVKYVPTNIPGAQVLQPMTSSHKVFNNALTLTFPKNAQLIRPKFNNSENLAGQVSNGHDILFAIANPNDGIINRREFESQAPNYSANAQAEGNLHIGYRFQDQARQFLKVSPLFWIDAGMADDPDTDQLDPIKMGMDPFPYPNIVGMHKESFAKRWNNFGRELIPSQAGSLTLTYDKSIVSSAATTITVFRFDPYNSTWENIGGVVDPKKFTITVPFTKFGYYVAVKMTRGYNDITNHPYARDAMNAVFAKGVMNAIDPIGVFGGDRFVTRGEFTRMMVRALDLPLNYEGDNHFTYYPETITNAYNASAIYDYRYIETAARAGIVSGKRPGFFDEDVELTRQEAAVIIARALNLKLETDSEKAKKNLDKVFKDSGNFDHYSIPAVLAIQKKGFIKGKLIDANNPKEGSVFEPKARLLRSDASIILVKVMNDLKKLPKIYN